MFVPGFFWLAYGVWESSLKGSGANIRIDLLLIYPLLFVAMIVGAGLTIFFTVKRPSGLPDEAIEADSKPDSETKGANP